VVYVNERLGDLAVLLVEFPVAGNEH